MANQQLPPPLAGDGSLPALCSAMEEMFAELPLEVLLVYLIDLVKTPLLPLLAEQFHVLGDEGWNLTSTEGQRRELIKKAIEIHRLKGTPWALKEIFRILRVDIKLEEWWQQQPPGQPHTFSLTAWVNDNLIKEEAILNADLYQRLRRMVHEVKPVRAEYQFRIGAGFQGSLMLVNATKPYSVRRISITTRGQVSTEQSVNLTNTTQCLTVVRVSMEVQ
ncbi:phage tail fibers [Yersinia pseudotuberculosis]|uniref:phage tail protein I n=1 Tax=Yersinia pseudotuberculosis complex TaxID=1649845 RepID=UPI0004F8084B|nr:MULTISPECIES: phage tail protein I [Yersinia pseudotuberculosis complex]AIN16398.1 phage tail protein I [Yersinia pseudotuberculosis]AJJ07451.1 phage tail protein I [Yersinia pseudotuberculosis]MBO1561861.1 phage tail protein I [Yersinia pseudotuberculosis]CNC37019.1 phage tail fibers [Yersinia similis]CNK24099.1 phage tail fibers [Yersinia pseudotuberculosis]